MKVYNELEVSFVELEAKTTCDEDDIKTKRECIKITPNQEEIRNLITQRLLQDN